MENNKLIKGIAWNLVSYIFLGIFSLCSYNLITWKYGSSALGAYNIILSIYMLSGHLGVFGLQSAILHFVPKQQGNSKDLGFCFSSFLLLVVFFGIIVSGCIYVCADFLGRDVFHSGDVRLGLKIMAPAVILFSINKFFAGYLNSLGCMEEYALLQGVRYFFIVSYVAVIVVMGCSFKWVFYSFCIAELGVFLLGLFLLYYKVSFESPKLDYICSGLRFGWKAMLGNVISDINTRIDIMMLGILCNDAVVGNYSFISIIVEGVMAILSVFRNNCNPQFSNLLYLKKKKELYSLYTNIKHKVRIFFAVMVTIIIIGYCIMCLLFLDESYFVSIFALTIILAGCFIMAPSFVGGNMCTLLGYPFVDTRISLVTILSNIVLNYMLIQRCQIVGAAIATGTSYILFSLLVLRSLRKYIWGEKC